MAGIGAGDGNRTHVSSLGSCSSTIELHPLFFQFQVLTLRLGTRIGTLAARKALAVRAGAQSSALRCRRELAARFITWDMRIEAGVSRFALEEEPRRVNSHFDARL